MPEVASSGRLLSNNKNDAPAAYRIGSKNVFQDLGVPRPAEARAKAQLVISISEAITARRLTQRAAANLVGLDQPKISRLLRGDTRGFSTERLFGILTALGRNVKIVVSQSSEPTGHVTVAARHRQRSGRKTESPVAYSALPGRQMRRKV